MEPAAGRLSLAALILGGGFALVFLLGPVPIRTAIVLSRWRILR